MSLILFPPTTNSVQYPCSHLLSRSNGLKFHRLPNRHLYSGFAPTCRRSGGFVGISSRTTWKKIPRYSKMSVVTRNTVKPDHSENMFSDEEILSDWVDEDDEGSPWEGAVVYKRNSSISHLEYCTTLERLGLSKISSEVSRSSASLLGLRVTKSVKDYPNGTPVLISVDVARRRNRLRLDGIIRTVISLYCNRCCEPAAENVYSNFSLLLTEEPVEEPEVINMGVIYGENKMKGSATGTKEEDNGDADIDLDDRLYFPAEEKEVDISKHIRDLVHLEININVVCSPSCKGICLRCGTNLNKSGCTCSGEEEMVAGRGPLGDLRKRMQHK